MIVSTMSLLWVSAVLIGFLLVGSHAIEMPHPRGTGAGNGFTKPPLLISHSDEPSATPILSPSSAPSQGPSTVSLDSPTLIDESNTDDLSLEPTDASDCWAIARGRGETNLPFLRLEAKLTLLIADLILAVLSRLNEYLDTFLATDLAGCALQQRRSRSQIRNVRFDVSLAETTSACTNCTDIGITVDIYFQGSDTSRFAEYLYQTLMSHCSLIASIDGVVEALDPCRYLSVIDATLFDLGSDANTTNVTDATEDPVAPEDSISTLGIMTLAFSALTIVIAVFAASKRRKRSQKLKHQELTEDDLSDETYLKDFEAASSSSGSSPDYSFGRDDGKTAACSGLSSSDGSSLSSIPFGSQMGFVGGEADSVCSSWSGFSNQQLGISPPTYSGSLGWSSKAQDHCASALCQACEARKRDLVPASMLGHSYDGRSARRKYLSHDTVQL